MRRILIFMVMNIAVVVTISIVMSILGVGPYINAYGLNYTSLAIFCGIWGMAGSFISLALSKTMAKWGMRVQIVEANSSYSDLVNRIHHFAKAAGLNKMPEVGVYDSPELNAFATGPSKNNSLVAVSTGLLQNMSRDEVDGVLAHEVAHIANGDMVTMALIQGVMNAFVMFFARIAAFALQNFLRGDDEEGSSFGGGWSYYISTFVFEVIFGFLAMFVVAWFSRQREYRADAGSAQYGGRGNMIAALQKLKASYPTLADSTDNVKAMKISSKSSFLQLLSTHPNLDDRIEALQKNSY